MGVIERPSQSKMSRNLSSFTSKVGKTKIFSSLFSQAQQTGQETFQWLTANSILREKNRRKQAQANASIGVQHFVKLRGPIN